MHRRYEIPTVPKLKIQQLENWERYKIETNDTIIFKILISDVKVFKNRFLVTNFINRSAKNYI